MIFFGLEGCETPLQTFTNITFDTLFPFEPGFRSIVPSRPLNTHETFELKEADCVGWRGTFTAAGHRYKENGLMTLEGPERFEAWECQPILESWCFELHSWEEEVV